MDLRRRMLSRANQYAETMKEAVVWIDGANAVAKKLLTALEKLEVTIGLVYPVDGNENASKEINATIKEIQRLAAELRRKM